MATKKRISSTRKKTTSKKSKASLAPDRGIEGLAYDDSMSPAVAEPDPFLDNYLLSWQAPEFVYHKKSVNWHIVVWGSIALTIIILAFLQNWLGVVLFIAIGVAVFRYAEVRPKDIEISITNVGIKVGNAFHPFNKLRAFWMVYEPPVKTLNIELEKKLSPIISVQLEDTDPFLVKNILKEHLPEETEVSEDLFDKFAKFLKF